MQIYLYNSLSRKIEAFTPFSDNEVKIYVCGITPYDASHLGHAFVFVFFDTLIRFIKFQGYKVTYVQNITDVDDDILKRAAAVGENWKTLGLRWIKDLLSDFVFLNIEKPDQMPKATESILPIIRIIERLLEKDHAYEVEDNVYFSIKSFQRYGLLARLSQEQMIKISAERGADPQDPKKKDPLDFVLWQKSKEDEPSWSSPWGRGRPGWHIECSAMSMKFLGEQIDIHGGGADLMFPHHESEIAQSESSTDKSPFVKYWLHCGMVLYESEKMSKSLGNLIFIKDLKKKFSANAIRWLLLSNHYRKPWEYREDELAEAQKTVKKIANSLSSALNPPTGGPPSTLHSPSSFLDTLSKDFNSPKALEIIKKNDNPEEQLAMWQLLGFKL